MEIKNFDRANVELVRRALNKHLEEIKKEHGIDFKVGTIKFSPINCRLTLEFKTEGDVDAEEDEFRRNCHMFGLTPKDYNRQFIVNGKVYRIRAIKPSRSKYPITGIDPMTNRMYKFSSFQVKFV